MDVMMPEPTGTPKTSPKQIRVQTLKAKRTALLLEGVAGEVWHLRPRYPGPGKCCWMSPWVAAGWQKWVIGKPLPAREENSPVSAALCSSGDAACPWGSRESLRGLCVVFCLGHQFAIIQLCFHIMQRQRVLASCCLAFYHPSFQHTHGQFK